MTCRGHSIMFMDRRLPKQQVIRCTSIYNMETSGCSYKPYGQVNINVTKSERCTAFKGEHLDRLLNKSTSMDPQSPWVLIDIIFKEDPGSISACPTPCDEQSSWCRDLLRLLGRTFLSLTENYGVVLESLPSIWHLLNKVWNSNGSISSMIALVMIRCWHAVMSIWS